MKTIRDDARDLRTRSAGRFRPAFTRLGGGILDLLFPRVCVACAVPLAPHETGVVCGRCWSRLALVPHPQCSRCGHPLRLDTWRRDRDAPPRACAWCALLPAYVRAARSVAWVGADGSAATIVHALKYGAWTATADGMAERMARLSWPADVVEERALLVPVPLASSRLRERGYNQSALLARALAPRWGVAVDDDALERTRATQTQTRLTPGERLANVRGAFRATAGAPERVRGRHVVLVDDVVTTAATLNACAAALFAAGARIVSYVTFGRARAAGDDPS